MLFIFCYFLLFIMCCLLFVLYYLFVEFYCVGFGFWWNIVVYWFYFVCVFIVIVSLFGFFLGFIFGFIVCRIIDLYFWFFLKVFYISCGKWSDFCVDN